MHSSHPKCKIIASEIRRGSVSGMQVTRATNADGHTVISLSAKMNCHLVPRSKKKSISRFAIPNICAVVADSAAVRHLAFGADSFVLRLDPTTPRCSTHLGRSDASASWYFIQLRISCAGELTPVGIAEAGADVHAKNVRKETALYRGCCATDEPLAVIEVRSRCTVLVRFVCITHALLQSCCCSTAPILRRTWVVQVLWCV